MCPGLGCDDSSGKREAENENGVLIEDTDAEHDSEREPGDPGSVERHEGQVDRERTSELLDRVRGVDATDEDEDRGDQHRGHCEQLRGEIPAEPSRDQARQPDDERTGKCRYDAL